MVVFEIESGEIDVRGGVKPLKEAWGEASNVYWTVQIPREACDGRSCAILEVLVETLTETDARFLLACHHDRAV